MTIQLAPDPRNVRDALLEAGYPLATVERMLLAAQGHYISAVERWPDDALLLYASENQSRIIANTWFRIANALGREALKSGALIREETHEGGVLTLRGRLWVLENK
jgi:hypothetical protein